MIRLFARLLAFLTTAFIGGLYFKTIAPGLTWAFDGADGGDLITAVATGGVPHPTGYPTYLILASTFLQIPIGSLAFRTNLLSLTAMVLASLLIFGLVRDASRSVLAASVAAIVFGTSPLVWSQAIITEVYALQALLTALFLAILVAKRRSRLTEMSLGVIAGLTLGNHAMGALLLPLLLIRPPATASTSPAKPLAVYWQRLLGLLIGLAIFLVIPLRAIAQSPVNWGNAVTPARLLSLMTGQMYWSRLAEANPAYVVAGLRSWANGLSVQLTVAGLLLAALGMVVLFRRNVLHVATLWIAVTSSLLTIIYYSPDSFVYAIPALISCAIWIGLGSDWLYLQVASQHPTAARIVMFTILGFFAARAILTAPGMDLSGDKTADDFGRAILALAPPRSIVLAGGDEATLALWYFHFALRQRQDTAVISQDLIAHDWYREVLRYTYPNLAFPREAGAAELKSANPGRPVCTVTSIVPPGLECSGWTGET